MNPQLFVIWDKVGDEVVYCRVWLLLVVWLIVFRLENFIFESWFSLLFVFFMSCQIGKLFMCTQLVFFLPLFSDLPIALLAGFYGFGFLLELGSASRRLLQLSL